MITEATLEQRRKTKSAVASGRSSPRKPTRAIPSVIAAIVFAAFGVVLAIAYFQKPNWAGGATAFGALFAAWYCLKDTIRLSGFNIRERPEYQEAIKLLGRPTEETIDWSKSYSFEIKEIVTFKRIPATLSISPTELRISGGIGDEELVVPRDDLRKVRLGLGGRLLVQVAGLSKLITLRAYRTTREFRLQQDSINVVAAWLNQSQLQTKSGSPESLEGTVSDGIPDKKSEESSVLRDESRLLEKTDNTRSAELAASSSKRSTWSLWAWQIGAVVVIAGILIYGIRLNVWGPYWRAQKLVSNKSFTDEAETFRVMTPLALRKTTSMNDLPLQLPGNPTATLTMYESTEESKDVAFGVSEIQWDEPKPRANKPANSPAQTRGVAEQDAIAAAVIDGSLNRLPAVQERFRETIVRGKHRVSRATAIFWPNKETGQTGVAVEVYVLPDRVYQLLAMVSWTTDNVPCVEQFFESFVILDHEEGKRGHH